MRSCLMAAVLSSLLWGPGVASAGRSFDVVTLAELEAGAMLLSDDGLVEFSDFDFNAVGFDESAFDEYYAQSRPGGFRLLLGFRELFGPGTLEMRYTVTPLAGFGVDGASIPFLALLEAVGASPLLETSWSADNGATLYGSTADTENFPWPGVSTEFDPTVSLMVEQIVTLSGGSGIAKVENAYRLVKVLPEPATGALLAMALCCGVALQRRRSGS